MRLQPEVHPRRLSTSRLFLIGLASALVLLAASTTWASGRAQSTPGPTGSLALDKVDALIEALQRAGFTLEGRTAQERVEFLYSDGVEETCKGRSPQAGNNPWPNVTLYASFQGVRQWQLGKDQALVLVGQTPPRVQFFHYQVFALTVPGIPTRMMMPVGDAINMATIHTIGPDTYNRPIVYVITGNRETERRVRAAAREAGYPEAIINVEAISPVIAPLGVGSEGSWFTLVHRLAVPLDPGAVESYAKSPPYRLFRVTPVQPLTDDPQPVPVLRVRGTGQTEMPLYPSLKKLRQAILDRYPGTPAKELDSKNTQESLPPDGHEALCDRPFVGLQRGVDVFGASRDTVATSSYPRFRLRKGADEFVIVYGVNHQTTGKATYSSFVAYADRERWLAMIGGSRSSNEYDGIASPGDSARRFLCPNDARQCPPDVQYLYAWKVARDCTKQEGASTPYCMELRDDNFVDKEGKPYNCDLYDWSQTPPNDPSLIGPFDLDAADLNITWRAYLEPATKVGPDDNELVYDRAIYFGPYFNVR